jgi:hypothetical protein
MPFSRYREGLQNPTRELFGHVLGGLPEIFEPQFRRKKVRHGGISKESHWSIRLSG